MCKKIIIEDLTLYNETLCKKKHKSTNNISNGYTCNHA